MQTGGVKKGRLENVAWAEAFTQVVRYCAENDELSIQMAGKLLLANINNIETSKQYATGAEVADLAENLDYIPPLLLVFSRCCCCFENVVAGEERT